METNHETTSMNGTLSAAGLLVESNKATEEMRRSISKFASLLICPLCNKIFDRPATLSACAHTFCMNCIDAYSANNSVCPVQGCGMPMSIVGSNGGSFRKLNLQISQTIESLQLICNSVNQSKENWWLSPATLRSIQEIRASELVKDQKESMFDEEQEENDDRNDFSGDWGQMKNEDNGDEGEEMIDLQASEDDEQLCVQTEDEQGTDGNISDDETI